MTLPSNKAQASSDRRALESDIALLKSLLSQGADVDESNPEEVAELLRRLDAAEDIADGIESRLDGIMDNLDNLLGDLEAEQGSTRPAEASDPAAEVKPDRVDTPPK